MKRCAPIFRGFSQAGYFTADEEGKLLQVARKLVPELPFYRSGCSFSHEKRGVQIFSNWGDDYYSCRGITQVVGTLEETLEIMKAKKTSQFRSLMRSMHGDNFIDGSVVCQQEGDADEQLSIKWICFKSHSAIVFHQDFCVLEYCAVVNGDIFGGDRNEKVGVILYESVDRKDCPSLLRSHRIERSITTHCGYLFRPFEKGMIEVQFVSSIPCTNDVKAKRRTNRHLLTEWTESLAQIQDSLRAIRISKMISHRNGATIWVSDDDRQCCHVCLRSFSKFRRKHHCRVCGEVICRKCSIYVDADIGAIGVTVIRMCKRCSLEGSAPEGNCKYDAPAKVDRVKATAAEDIYSLLCDLALQSLGCKFAIVTLKDEKKQWWKSTLNISDRMVPSASSYCEYPIDRKAPFIVMNAQIDPKFRNDPAVAGPLGIKFIAGAPLFTANGLCVGSVCVLDTEIREALPETCIDLMEKLAHLAMISMQERREAVKNLSQRNGRPVGYQGRSSHGTMFMFDTTSSAA